MTDHPNRSADSGPVKNTDREIYHTPFNSVHDDSIHVTQGGGIGINVAGNVIVKPLRGWHALASIPTDAQPVGMREALETAQAHLLKYTGGFGANKEEVALFAKIEAALASQPSPAATVETRGSGVEMIDNLSPEALANWQDEGNCNAGRPQCSAGSESERRNIAIFGHGFFGVDIGTLGDIPAVFIVPNEQAGPVGEKIPIELQGPLELEVLPDHWIALTFPTRERCKEVADAIVGSKMEKWTNG